MQYFKGHLEVTLKEEEEEEKKAADVFKTAYRTSSTDSAKIWNVISIMPTAFIKCHNYLAKTKKNPKHY